MGRDSTVQRGGAAALALMLLVSLMAGSAAAAVAGVTIAVDAYEVDQGDEKLIEVDVEADADGIDGETLTVDVIDPDTGDTAYTVEEAVSVDADSTETFEVTVDADGLDVGTYDIEATVDGTTATSELWVDDPGSVDIEQDEYALEAENDSVTVINTTLEAGESVDRSGTVLFSVYDADGELVHDAEQADVEVLSGEDETVTFEVASEDIDETGEYDVQVDWSGYTDEAELKYGDTVLAGGALDDASNDPVVVGGIVALIAVIAGLVATRD